MNNDEFIFPECSRYFSENQSNLKYQFPGVENIENNYSQAFQDMFVLSMLNGKRNGTYVEIGADHGVIISNTYLLETEFGWKGVSFEIDKHKVNLYNKIRNNKCMCVDATEFDYKSYFVENNYPMGIIQFRHRSKNHLRSSKTNQTKCRSII